MKRQKRPCRRKGASGKELADLKEFLEETCLETTAKPRLGAITQREYSSVRDAIEPASQIS